ncbi:hypothetical protein [Rhodoplanes roseus]|uniref:hypothetical protein n=1 Tax=Rhodoplanes roseus TaxID=29409 RepID=UPI001AED03ED|nr:hypothetical protein [Rhodoplanes roseus]
MATRTRLVAVALVLGTIGAATAASAQGEYRGTAAQQRACRPDVFRLCAGEIPNVRAITACLAARMSRLSPDCRAVFEAAGYK